MIGRVYHVVLDCPDPRALSAFYAELTGMTEQYAEDRWVTLSDGTLRLGFQQAVDFRAPRWPDPAHPQQMHLDVLVEDVASAEQKVLALGATRLPGEGPDWRVYADPVGHPFCLIWENGTSA